MAQVLQTKPDQVLVIKPKNELRFQGPFNAPITSYMKLENPSKRKVLFKIKTTTPEQFYVRPKAGVLDPNECKEVAVCFRPPSSFDPAEKIKQKLMVQAAFAPYAVDVYVVGQLWEDVWKKEVMESKIKCVFETPVDANDNYLMSSLVRAVPNLRRFR